MTSLKEHQRKRRHNKIRAKVSRTTKRPRLVIFRSNSAIYAQLVNDAKGQVLATSSSLKMKEKGVDAAKKVGLDIAKLAKGKKISTCIFDRGGYLYHGRVKALAEGAREGGLKF